MAEGGPEMPGSFSLFVAPLLGCWAGPGTWWALPSISSIHLAGHMAPCSWVLHLCEQASLLLALTAADRELPIHLSRPHEAHAGRKPIR